LPEPSHSTALATIDEQLWSFEDRVDDINVSFPKMAMLKVLDPLKYYVPNGPGEEYIKTFARCTEQNETPTILVTWPNGASKSHSTIMLVMNVIYGPQSAWFDYPIFHHFPYPHTFWYISTADALKDTVIPGFMALLKPGTFHALKHGKNHVSEIIVNGPKGKFQIMFKTFDQNPKVFESTSCGLIVGDEPLPESIYTACLSRRRMGCIMLLPMTPLDCAPYIVDKVMAAAHRNEDGFFHLECEIWDVCMRRGVRGHLAPNIIDSMVNEMDPEEFEARAKGKHMYYSGSIYKQLNREEHFVEPSDYPIPPYATIYQVVDPHDARESACIYAALCPNGRWIIFAETPTDNSKEFWRMDRTLEIDDEVRAWIQIEKDHHINDIVGFDGEVVRVMDRHFGWQTRGQKTLAGLYAEEARLQGRTDFNYMASSGVTGGETGEIAYGHKMVRKALKPRQDGKPGLVIWNTCIHTWRGMTHYIIRKLTGAGADEKAKGEGVIVERFRDYPDVVRYLVVSSLEPNEEPIPISREKARFDAIKTPDNQTIAGPRKLDLAGKIVMT